MNDLKEIVAGFAPAGKVVSIEPFGGGLINDSYKVTTEGAAPDYVLQRINHHIFKDVEMLQRNIGAVTAHIREKLQKSGGEGCTGACRVGAGGDAATDIDRRVLSFVAGPDGKTYRKVGDNYWRMSVFIPDSKSLDTVTPRSAELAGEAFGNFESMLADLPETLGEVIPDFHNIEFRLQQLRDAVREDKAGRLDGGADGRGVRDIVAEIEKRADAMCLAERLHRQGRLPKRVCHCDTKVNNMLFDDATGDFLCVVDLDTTMPSYVFSDFGDFLRTGASTAPEDEPDLGKIAFDMDIFRAFATGYLRGAGGFLTPAEIENLPYGASLFPYMQAVRFFADYLNGDTYYKVSYPEHNLVRTRAQLKLLESIESHLPEMKAHIENTLRK